MSRDNRKKAFVAFRSAKDEIQSMKGRRRKMGKSLERTEQWKGHSARTRLLHDAQAKEP